MARPTSSEYVVLQFAMPHYRQWFLDELEHNGVPVRFLVGDSASDAHSQTEVDGPLVYRTGENIWLLRRRFGVQHRAFLRAVTAHVTVVQLNPGNLTALAVMLARRLLGRPTVAWGHAWPRRGAMAPSDRLRSVVRRIPTALLVYTETERAELLTRWPTLRIFVAPNAIYPAHEMQPAAPSGVDPVDLVWIGRMIELKRPLLAIDGFEQAVDQLPDDARLIMVGSGPELETVRERVATSSVGDRIVVTGQVTDHDTLAKIFGDAVAMVATGYIGLNATQSTGFGVPVVYPRGEPHAPEAEALNEYNSIAFAERDALALKEALVEVFKQRDMWHERREEISRRARSRYSSEAMARGFVEALENVADGAV